MTENTIDKDQDDLGRAWNRLNPYYLDQGLVKQQSRRWWERLSSRDAGEGNSAPTGLTGTVDLFHGPYTQYP